MELIALEDHRKGKGRTKMEIKRVETEDDRIIRKKGIYQKISEISTECGAQIGMVLSSPAGKPFSLGNPSIEAVLERYLNWKSSPQLLFDNGNGGKSILEARTEDSASEELGRLLMENLSQLEEEKKRGRMLREKIKASREADATSGRLIWWEARIDKLSMPQLDILSLNTEQFCNEILNHVIQSGNIIEENNPVASTS